MHRVVCRAFGPPEELVLETVDEPVPGPGQVCVDVTAAGVNFVDALIVAGGYQIKPPLPFTPGTELAGVVSAVGDGVEVPAVGDRVLVTGLFGGFAEQVCVPAAHAVRLPAGIDDAVAATFAQSHCTVGFALTRRDTVHPGETVLVLGAGGGVGLAGVALAKALGARVVAAASSPEKLAAARSAGADEVIDYGREDLKTRVRELTDGGADVVLDPVGGALAEAALRSTRWFGRFHVIGFAAGEIPRMPLNLALLNNRTIIGIDWGAWSIRNPGANRELLGELLVMAADGRLVPPAPRVAPLADAGPVLREFLERRVVGKVALVP